MKLTIKEAMKRINLYEQQLNNLLTDEIQNHTITYLENEKPEYPEYTFENTTKEIEKLQDEVLALRKAINLANQQTLIGINDFTISDGLVRIAQLTNNSNRYHMLSSEKQKTRMTTHNDSIEYTECVYDVKEVKDIYFKCIEDIHALQTAIDKANLLTEIEV